jgi:hypothetical protein
VIVVSDLLALSKIEKLTMMELLWSDLTSSSDELDCPSWHIEALQETSRRYDTGKELPTSWISAKEQLISERR